MAPPDAYAWLLVNTLDNISTDSRTPIIAKAAPWMPMFSLNRLVWIDRTLESNTLILPWLFWKRMSFIKINELLMLIRFIYAVVNEGSKLAKELFVNVELEISAKSAVSDILISLFENYGSIKKNVTPVLLRAVTRWILMDFTPKNENMKF